MYKNGYSEYAEKIYYLNKTINSIDLFYELDLPVHFGVEHPLGTVLGRAIYGDRLYVYQNCTIGVNFDRHPILGDNIIMYAGSKIIGGSKIGSNVILGANVAIVNTEVPDNSVVYNSGGILTVREMSETQRSKHFDFHFKSKS